ncbi:DUF1566 domain-containing protein, partial [Winogradskyella sp.]|nr:DUF1566 domain-containing protein [Winogradskyella sp.]
GPAGPTGPAGAMGPQGIQGIAGTNSLNTLTEGNLFVGDGNGEAAGVALSGDATLNTSGVLSITDNAVTNTKLDKTNIPLSGFGAAATNVALGANKLTGVADPTEDQDAATKIYVDGLIAALEARIVELETVPVLPAVGDFRDGGVVIYVSPTPTDLNGDGILDTGLVCAIEDQGISAWYDQFGFFTPNGTSIGSGAENSEDILLNIFGTNNAVSLTLQYTGGGFNDWFLPSKDELSAIYTHRNVINITALANSGSSLSNGGYWSSSVSDILSDSAWFVDFASGNPSITPMTQFNSIRAVRVF